VFIGPTGGGKSTLAKLASMMRDVEFYTTKEGPAYLMRYYNLLNFFDKKSSISLRRGEQGVRMRGYHIDFDAKTKQILQYQTQEAVRVFNERSSTQIPGILKPLQRAIEVSKLDKVLIAEQITDSIKSITDDLIEATSSEIAKLIFTKLFLYTNPLYVPSERIFLSSISNSWAGLMRDDIGLPPPLLDFANAYLQARLQISDLPISLLDVSYSHKKGEDYIILKNKKKPLRLHETASGIQSVTPLLVLLEHLSRNTEQAQSFIIEEPELNLYPTAQQGLLNWLVEKCTKGENDLTITTHSPYILSSCNLLLEAYKVAQLRPDLEDEIAAIVPKACWLNP
ncbi:MAG: ATP-binding protein, partial [Hymenobacter sp.]